MAPRRRQLPSFFKILLDRAAPHLLLPSDFVRKHLENNIPEDPLILSVNGGHSWRLKIKKDGDIYCFADGWNDVVEDSLLEFGDFLVFWLVDQSTFKLSVFSPNGCEKVFPLKTEVEHDDHQEEEEDEVAEKEEEVEDDDDDDDDEDVEEEEDDDDEEEESDEEEEEEEDDDIYDDGGGGGGGEVEEDDGDEDDDGGVDIDGDDGDPFFMKIITNDHKSSMRFPSEFARLAGMDEDRTIKMKNLDGKEWPMRLLSEGRNYTRYYLSAGWTEFRKANRLLEGDKCVFKFLKSEGKLCLAKVTKKRVPTTEVKKRTEGLPPPPRVEVESKDNPATEGKNRTGGLPPPPPTVEVESKDNPATEGKNRTGGLPPQQPVEVESKDNGAEVVKKKGRRGKRTASEVPAAEVLTRTRRQPPRVAAESKDNGAELAKKRGRQAKQPANEVPAGRTRGKRRRVEVESKDDGQEVVKEKARDKQPVTEVLKRPRGRPPRVEEKVQSKNLAGKTPVAEVPKRKRGRPVRVGVERKDDGAKVAVAVAKRPRGRPFKKKRGRGRGRPPAHVK